MEIDELFEDSGNAVIDAGRGSVAFLQRKFNLGYGRASRILEQLEGSGVVGPYVEGCGREILMTSEQFFQMEKVKPGDGKVKPKMSEQSEKKNEIEFAGKNNLDQLCLEFPKEDSQRGRILHCVRDFRRGWVELGRLLCETAIGGDYKEWGYDDFAVYCARELGIKKNTTKKLMVSYNYIKKNHQKKLTDGTAVPDYTTVELLDRMNSDPETDAEALKEVEAKVFDQNIDNSELRKEMRDHLSNEETMTASRKRELGDILRTARNLRRKLSHSIIVPEGLKDRMEQQLVELESLD